MKTIEQTYEIKAPLEEVWRAFVDSKIIEKWGGGPAKMSDKENNPFSLWGGDIWGTNTKVVKHKLLEQHWTSGKWEKPSKVQFSFSEYDGKTTVKLLNTDVPDKSAKDIDQGWKDYYLGPIKELLES